MKKCVVITGTGRSGTSLTAGLLYRAGVVMSEDMVEASAQNPRGSYEDRRIQLLQREMLSQLGPLTMPPPKDWLKTPAVANSLPKLRDVVREGIESARGAPWGFKDPHSAFTMPLWTRIFNELKVVPSTFLCVREPSAVITSLIRQYDFDSATAEVFWLTKIIRPILDTGADLFIVNYETLLTGDKATLTAMLDHAGVSGPESLDEVTGFIEPKLNRSGTNSYKITNPRVDRLWAALADCQGADFDRDALMRTAQEIQSDMAQWSGLMNEIYRFHQAAVNAGPARQERAQSAELEAARQTIATQQRELETAREMAATQLRELETAQGHMQDAAEEISRLRVFAKSLARNEPSIRAEARKKVEALKQEQDRQKAKISALQKERDRYKDEIIGLYGSTTYQAGRHLREIRDRPISGLIRLPSRLRNLLRAQRSKQSRGLL